MFLKSFWEGNRTEIIVSSLFALVSIALLLMLSIVQNRQKKSIKNIVLGLAVIILILFGVTYALYVDGVDIFRIVVVDSLIIAFYSVICFLIIDSKRDQSTAYFSISKVALLSLLIGLASVLMLFGIPILPAASFLKLEFSGLVYFMVFLWFDFKSAVLVCFLTNIIHAIMPSTSIPLIPFLDEMVNVVACITFMLPSAIAFRKLEENEKPNGFKVVLSVFAGTLFTTIFMTLYNQFINIPLYEILLDIDMGFDFKTVLTTFGVFNIAKWGGVALLISLLWHRLYDIKNINLNLSSKHN